MLALMVSLAFVALGAWLIIEGRRDAARLRDIAAARAGESICQFARAFHVRQVDTGIIRAVYEELGRCFGSALAPFPLRADDDLFGALELDGDDFDEAVVEIASRTRRSLDDYQRNPHYATLRTPRDVVAFLMAQPRRA
jgi:hypothetical protein